jgi:hypothetical protein
MNEIIKVMTNNVGSIDKIARFIIAIVIGVLYVTNVITGVLGIVFLVVGAILAITGFINFCPIWSVIGVKTTSEAKT